MAIEDSKITALTADTDPLSADVFPIVDVANDETKKITYSVLKTKINTLGLTEGSVPYVNSSGALTEDSLNLQWDNTNKRFYVGYNEVLALHYGNNAINTAGTNIKNGGVGDYNQFENISASIYPSISVSSSRYTLAGGVDGLSQDGDLIGNFEGLTWSGTGTSYLPRARVLMRAKGSTLGTIGGQMEFSTMVNGGATPQTALTIDNVQNATFTKNVFTNNVSGAYTTTATAAGTTTLTSASTYYQFFTGSTTQTVTLPVTSTLVTGMGFYIVNNSSGVVTVNSSGANAVVAMGANTVSLVTCILTSGTTAASWNATNVITPAGTQTLTNKRNTRRVGTVASSATPTINTDNVDLFTITALAAAITSFTTNLSGTPTDGQLLQIAITDNGTARALTFGASFEASGTVALPTTTVISTRLDILFVWNAATSKFRCIASS